MKRTSLFLGIPLAAALAAFALPQAAFDASRGVITLPEPGSPFIAFNIWVKAGSQNDPAGKEGLAALTAAMLSNGSTTADSYEAILGKLYPMAAGYGSSVDKEMTVFRGRVHRDNLEAYYDLFRNAILSPAFNEDDFNRLKSQTLNFLERGRRFGRDEELSKDLLFWMAYQGTPYQHPQEGYVESVRSITLEDVEDFYARAYLRDNVVVAVGGGYPAGFADRVRSDLNSLPAGELSPAPPPEPSIPDGVKVLLVEKEANASPVSMGFPISLLRGDGDFWAMVAANSWFGEHRNSFSRLYQVIRETRGMNYGDYSYIEAFPQGYATQQPPVNAARRSHLFEIWIRPISNTRPGNLHERTLFATRAALRELQLLVEEGLPPQEVERTKGFLRNFTVNWGNTITRRLAYAVDDAFYGLPAPGYLGSIRPGLEALAPEAVNAAIGTHLRSEGLYIVIITSDAQGMRQKLLQGTPTFLDYPGPQSEGVLAEDQEIGRFPIPVRAEDITILDINQVFQGG